MSQRSASQTRSNQNSDDQADDDLGTHLSWFVIGQLQFVHFQNKQYSFIMSVAGNWMSYKMKVVTGCI